MGLVLLGGVLVPGPAQAIESPPDPSLLLDIVSGPDGSDPFLTGWRGAAWFIARDGVGGAQLWRSDGTLQGTEMVLDPTVLCGQPRAFWSIHPGDDVLYIRGQGCAGNQQLYVTGDQPEWGATSFPLTTDGGFVSNIAIRDDDAFFTYGPAQGFDELWFSDGTPEATSGTHLVKDLWPGPGRVDVREMTVYGDHAYFIGRDLGPEMLFRSDGTEAGTEVFFDIEPNSRRITHSFTVIDDLMWFRADVGVEGAALWVTDGTVPGTRVVADTTVGGEWPVEFTSFDGSVVYAAQHPTLGNELFRTDGTEPGTELFVDVVPGPAGSRPRVLTPAESLLYFSGEGPGGSELYVVAADTSEVTQLTDWIEFHGPTLLGTVDEDLLFSANDGFNVHGEELWIVEDGATRLVLDINPGPAGSWPSNTVETDNGVLFSADDGEHGRELWLFDPDRVIEVDIDIRPGSETNPINLRSRGVIPVAILTTDDFDASTVDPRSLRFGPVGARAVHRRGHPADVDGDGDRDLLLHFRIRHTGIAPGDSEACLTGETSDGRPIEGCNRITVRGQPRYR